MNDAMPRRRTRATPAARRSRDVVMADVAIAAGVSHMTVSRVLNGTARVSPATRARVEEALRALGYRPNAAARALATGRSGQLSVVFFDTTLFGPASALFAIEQAARHAGYSVNIVSLPHIDQDTMRDAVATLRSQAVDGTIIVAPHTTAAAAVREVPADLPAVVVAGAQTSGLPVVAIDQETGARLATEHLLQLGHRTVWHVAGPGNWVDAKARARGWRKTLQRSGIPVPPALVGDWSARSGYEAGVRLAADPDVTAVFVANDHMALGVLRALALAGRRVPQDVSVVGFDDVPESPYYPPALTTVRQDFEAVGVQAVAALLARINGQEPAPRELLVPELIIRESTAGPPS
ncbi:MAG: LacI family DNA-binding transcriptional regulator [Dactylosporangium sp.]|nr:LacI family DNA-binding transcriptional regulator [Dactylosporangium sp.]